MSRAADERRGRIVTLASRLGPNIVRAIVLALLDDTALKSQPIRVRHHAETADVEPSHHGRSRIRHRDIGHPQLHTLRTLKAIDCE